MPRRTVVAGQLKPAGHRKGPRSIYVCLPVTTTASHAERVRKVLSGVVRPSDRLLYATQANVADPVTSFASSHGNAVNPIADERVAPDLILIIIDPLGDNESALEARTLAAFGDSDIFITELPDPE